MKPIQLLMGINVLALSLWGGACATSTQSAVKEPALPSPPPAQAASTASPAVQDPADKIARMKPAEAVRLVTAGDAILVDVRDVNSYETMHAKGAIHVSFQDISEGKYDKLPKNKHLIFYCT